MNIKKIIQISLIMLVIVVAITTIILKLTHSNSTTKGEENVGSQDSLVQEDGNHKQVDDIEKKYKEQLEENQEENQVQEELGETMGAQHAHNEFDEMYTTLYGESFLPTAEQHIEKLMQLYVTMNTDWPQWSIYATDTLIKEMEQNFNKMGFPLQQEVKGIETFAVMPGEEKTAEFGVKVTLHVKTTPDEPVRETTNLYYITFDMTQPDTPKIKKLTHI